jgi:hypothetical protein
VVELFFVEMDRTWRGARTPKIKLRLIGSTALMLQTSYARGTKDGDVLRTMAIDDTLKQDLLDHAGERTKLHTRHLMYLDIVENGVPFLPQSPVWHPMTELNAKLGAFEFEALDVVDVVVSKLKRFSANDRSDILEMIKRDRVPHDRLLERFRAAADAFAYDARASDLKHYVRNLHRVERDMLGVDPPTPIDLPDWV